ITMDSLSSTTGGITLDSRQLQLTAGLNLSANVSQDIVLTATRDIKLNASANGSNGLIIQTTKTIMSQDAWDWDILEMRSSDVVHGMTTITNTGTFGALGKNSSDTGGLLVRGFAEGIVGLNLAGYGTTVGTGAGNAAVQVSAFKRSGTGVVDFAAGENLFAVRNNITTRFYIQGNGNFFYDGVGAAYDTHDDVGLLRALSRTWSQTIEGTWDRFVTYNRDHLEEAGILAGDFVNGAALNRLLTGAIWQMHERIAELEATVSRQSGHVS
ncbi:MAG: hypothetical protein R6X18_09615, partial [Chloroflexota bacterium]